MKITLLSVGQRPPKWVNEGYEEYAKRMPKELNFGLKEIKPEPRSLGKNKTELLSCEAQRIEAALPKNAHIVVLDEHGLDLTTQALSNKLATWLQEESEVVLIIGGPDGLDDRIKARAHLKLRLSSLTLPHALVRPLIAEALYRAWSLHNNHPYHRE